ncbi:tetratricopeptide repeat protein [Kiritimatiella glycovorans]|uniref:LysM domain/BON superfamily protein n=1 Tax=Kiritimatiella glycovorans TaxID=1307763 RepID=A0A0G3EL81_9BACT|nr:tetratricopeptide repeat protein [Kiritimatiella glycovorans]AKJ64889.1 LysM domain/BON superfamily protein [Kiritimatiella glycovorans]
MKSRTSRPEGLPPVRPRSAAHRRFLLPALVLPALLLLASCGPAPENPDARDERRPAFRKAVRAREAGRTEESIALLRTALRKHPDMARAHLELARIFHEQRSDYARAIHHYRRYLEQRPEAQKKPLVENWIETARADFVREMMRSEAAPPVIEKLKVLERENRALKARLARGEAPAEDNAPPERGTLSRSGPEKESARPSPKSARKKRTYVVRGGDTLSRIAARVYGDAAQWRLIYEANRDRMKSERDLQIGQVLTLPPPDE